MTYRQVQRPERLHALLDAIMLIEADHDLSELLAQIVRLAAELVDARYGALAVLNRSADGFSEFVTVGMTDQQRAHLGRLPEGKGLLGEVIHAGRTIRSEDITREPGSSGFPQGHPVMHAFLGVPVRLASGAIFGNLYLTDKTSEANFSAEDEALVEAFGRAAALVVESSRQKAALTKSALLEDRERIARDLHDTVIQRLFAVGLSLQTALVGDVAPDTRQRIDRAVHDLDTTVREIRTTIFEIGPRPDGPDGVRARLLEVANEVPSRLGLPVDVSFEGPIDTLVGPHLATHLVASLRELLANVVRHAQASRARVIVRVDPERCELIVSDDGVGATTTDGFGRGLSNVHERATTCEGGMTLTPTVPHGTTVTWWATRLEY